MRRAAPLAALLAALAMAASCGDDDGAEPGRPPFDAALPAWLDLLEPPEDGGQPPSDGGLPCGLVDCRTLDSECGRGYCDADAGVCVVEPEREEESCDDGDPCTVDDQCLAGSCEGTPLDCGGGGNPCRPYACEPETGECVEVPLDEGAACSDDDECTEGDACQGGICAGTPLDCSSLDDACNVGLCDSAVGCVQQAMVGAACDDGDACTGPDYCDASGVCLNEPLDCSALEGPCASAACNPTTGSCEVTLTTNDTVCDDSDPCTESEVCADGLCVGDAVVCPGGDACHVAACSPSDGSCLLVEVDDGSTCDDGDHCTHADQCTSGVCAGTEVVCPAGPCEVGVCDAADGSCGTVAAPDTAVCDEDPTDCQTQTCNSGSCDSAPVVDCTACGGQSGFFCRQGACESDRDRTSFDFEAVGLPAGLSTDVGAPWTTTTGTAFAGSRSARSAVIGAGEKTTLSYPVAVGNYASVSFAFRTSSASGDVLEFTGGAVDRQWSGALPWGAWQETLAAGRHTLSWSYERSGGAPMYENAAWIDELVVEGHVTMEGFDAGIPAGSFSTSGDAGWTTGGAPNATAVPGAITGGQTSSLVYDVSVTSDSRVTFFYQTDTADTHVLSIWVDNVQVLTASGVVPWAKYTTAILSTGAHSIEWRYSKDDALPSAADQVLVDDVFVEREPCQ